jgi:hypothetical protein
LPIFAASASLGDDQKARRLVDGLHKIAARRPAPSSTSLSAHCTFRPPRPRAPNAAEAAERGSRGSTASWQSRNGSRATDCHDRATVSRSPHVRSPAATQSRALFWMDLLIDRLARQFDALFAVKPRKPKAAAKSRGLFRSRRRFLFCFYRG